MRTLAAVVLQAQQRYRERRKQKFAEMEQSLAVLTTRVEELQDAQQAAAHAHAQVLAWWLSLVVFSARIIY